MSSSPRPRSIDFLTPDQLRRKREGDRRSQKLSREKTKAHISSLELRIQELERHVRTLQSELDEKSPRCTCRMVEQQPSPESPQKASWHGFDMSLLFEQSPQPTDDTLFVPGEQSCQGHQKNDTADSPPDSDIWSRILDDVSLAPSEQTQSPSDTPVNQQPAFTMASQLASTATVWSTLPKHLPASCPLDQVVTGLIHSRRQHELTGGNIAEFQRRAFPSIQSLLNPTYEALKSPVTTAIVNNIIHVMTVPTLPEQIAILYVMSTVIRWHISPTRSNYDSMPAWLRPTPSQLIHPHSVWLDLFVWPKAREHMCREAKYQNQHSVLSRICNESLSINWPHQPSDMIMNINGKDTILNPIFERHIRTLRNWTVGKRILEVYPELTGEVNIGLARDSTRACTSTGLLA